MVRDQKKLGNHFSIETIYCKTTPHFTEAVLGLVLALDVSCVVGSCPNWQLSLLHLSDWQLFRLQLCGWQFPGLQLCGWQ